jgi:ATP-binding cassette subfamily B protein/ATP-binding cassette subfamily B protein RtxE
MQTFIRTACKAHAALLISTITTIIILKLIALAPPLLLGNVIDTLNSDDRATLNTLLLLTGGFILAGCVQAIINPLQVFFYPNWCRK